VAWSRRLQQPQTSNEVFLPLHGGSGTNDDDLREAIAAGINIVHINDQHRAHQYRATRGLATRPGGRSGKATRRDRPYRILPSAVDAVKAVAGLRLKLFNERRKLALPA
jgi:fructose-bisphosphate aldolase class II